MGQEFLIVRQSRKEPVEAISGPICPLPGVKTGSTYKGGAVTSAFLSAFL